MYVNSLAIPMATSKHNPMLGMYRTRSATTNPTGKIRLEAGKNGNPIRAKANKTKWFPCLNLHSVILFGFPSTFINFKFHGCIDRMLEESLFAFSVLVQFVLLLLVLLLLLQPLTSAIEVDFL